MPHTFIMANRTCSTIWSLHILGNSVWGLDYANWHKAYLGIVFPLLSYGTTVWLNDCYPKAIISWLVVAQNDALHHIAGVFHTIPTAPLPILLNILLIYIHL
jgi:hypothetical protein